MSTPNTIYRLTSENLTGLGSQMGTERTWNNWEKYYDDLTAAKRAAQRDYGPEPLRWKSEHGGWSTDDLGHVMYHVHRIHLEKS